MSSNIEELSEKIKIENLGVVVQEHDRQIKTLNTTVTNIDSNVKEIHSALIGDLKTKGIITQHRENCDYIEACKKRKEEEAKANKEQRIDWFKWGFRLVGGITISVIWVKILKLG